MANRLLIVAKREYVERVRSRWFVVTTLLVPVFLSGAFLFPVWLSTRSAASASVRNVIVLDATGAGVGKRVIENLLADSSTAARSTRGLSLPVAMPQLREVAPAGLSSAEANALHQVMAPNSYVGYLVLTDSTLAGKSARYAGRNASSLSDLERLRTAVRQAVTMVRLEKEGVSTTTIDEVSKINLKLPAERVDDRGRGGSGQAGFFVGIVIAVMLFMSIMMHGQAILRGALEEKTTRVAEVVLSSVKPETLLAGKVLGVGAVGLSQQILWLAISAYLMTTFAPIIMHSAGGALASGAGAAPTTVSATIGGLSAGTFIAILLFFLVGFVFYSSLFAAAGAMVNSEQEAQQAVMPVTVLIVAVWLCVNPVLMNPNSTLAIALSWIPLSSPIILPMRMGLVTVPWWTVVGSLACGIVGCVFVVWLAARIYRVGMLMYGKRPTLAEVARWVRYA